MEVIKPEMALIPNEGDVLKVLEIHKATLFCIFLNSLRGYTSDVLL